MATLKSLIKAKNIRLEKVPEAFLSEVEKLQKKMFTDLISLLDSIDKEGGFIKASAGNIRKLSSIMTDAKEELFGTDYVEVATEFIKEFDLQKAANDNIFEKEFKEFSGSDLADELLRKSKEDALQALLGSPLDTEFLQPLDKLLSDSIGTGASWKDTVQSIRDFVEGNPEADGRLLQYSKTIARDSFTISDRSYTNAIADELESEWFFWSGGILSTSRCICIKNSEHYFHFKEIEAFARGENLGDCKVGDLWAGAVPATNEKTIFIYAGGFGCLHSIMPVSVFSVPQETIDRNIQNGNYVPSEKELALING